MPGIATPLRPDTPGRRKTESPERSCGAGHPAWRTGDELTRLAAPYTVRLGYPDFTRRPHCRLVSLQT